MLLIAVAKASFTLYVIFSNLDHFHIKLNTNADTLESCCLMPLCENLCISSLLSFTQLVCNSREEDPRCTFLAVCNALQARQALLSHAPLNLSDPIAFAEIIIGIDWIDDLEAQAFFIQQVTLQDAK